MASAEVKHLFNLSADRMWALIGDFGDTGKWSGRPPEACRRDGHGIGALRTLFLADGREIVDRLIDEGPMTYCYEIVTSPLPVASYQARMTIKPVSDAACELIWSGTFQPAGITDAEAVVFFEDIYRMGIAMMERQLAKMGKSMPGGVPTAHVG